MRDGEAQMHKDISDVAGVFLERFMKGEVENAMELPDSLVAVRTRSPAHCFQPSLPSVIVAISLPSPLPPPPPLPPQHMAKCMQLSPF